MKRKRSAINKNALINQIASKCSLSAKDIATVLGTFQEVLLENINNNCDTRISGFLSFDVIEIAQRVGFNRRTGEKVKVDAQKRVNAKVSDVFQKLIKQENFLSANK